MTSPSPYKTDPYKRRLRRKKITTDEESSESTPDNESTEGETETSTAATKGKPTVPSSFSADAIKRRLNRDKFNTNG